MVQFCLQFLTVPVKFIKMQTIAALWLARMCWSSVESYDGLRFLHEYDATNKFWMFLVHI